jgi:hypothetical protein
MLTYERIIWSENKKKPKAVILSWLERARMHLFLQHRKALTDTGFDSGKQ